MERTENTSGDNGQSLQRLHPVRSQHPQPRGENPNLVLGYHRQWSPGNDTVFLYRNLQDTYTLSDPALSFTFYTPASVFPILTPAKIFAQAAPVAYRDETVLNSMELQHIFQTASQRLILGGRYQIEDHRTADFRESPHLRDLFRRGFPDGI